jgi:hypothetical protein
VGGSLEERLNFTNAIRIAGTSVRNKHTTRRVRQCQGVKINVLNAFPGGVRHAVSPEVGLECESYGVRWAFVAPRILYTGTISDNIDWEKTGGFCLS